LPQAASHESGGKSEGTWEENSMFSIPAQNGKPNQPGKKRKTSDGEHLKNIKNDNFVALFWPSCGIFEESNPPLYHSEQLQPSSDRHATEFSLTVCRRRLAIYILLS
jgi:hypothetical protein